MNVEGPPDPQPRLATLPLLRWAARVQRGQASLRGSLPEMLSLSVGSASLRIADAIDVEVDFIGGDSPSIVRLDIRGALSLDGRDGRHFGIGAFGMAFDGETIPDAEACAGQILEALSDRLGNLRVTARAEPRGDLKIKLGHGVEVAAPAGTVFTVRGVTVGPAGGLHLSEPLIIGFDGDGLNFSHDTFRRLSRLVNLRLSRATLHPDGSVALEGRGARPVDGIFRMPLQKASARLSDMVRSSPRFGRVRAFLR